VGHLADLLRDHVARFNDAVTTGDFGAMVAGFATDGEMRFEGVPVGPFTGRDAIAAAYAARPPDDVIDLLEVDEGDDLVVARYGWRRDGGAPAGDMRLTESATEPGRIGSLTITFDAGC
jgi:hypothetical protein